MTGDDGTTRCLVVGIYDNGGVWVTGVPRVDVRAGEPAPPSRIGEREERGAPARSPAHDMGQPISATKRRGSTRYAKNRSCGACGTALEPGTLYCHPCQGDRVQVYRERREAPRLQPGPNLVACCDGTWHPILLQESPRSAKSACCGKVFAIEPEKEAADAL